MRKQDILGVVLVAVLLAISGTLLAADTASNPYPPDGDTNGASPDVVLSWTAGDNAAESDGHDVYFGTSYTAVLNATTASPEYAGRQTATAFDPGGSLTAGTTYYWRVDELNPSVSPYIWTGAVWSFTVFDGSEQPADFENGYAVWVADTMTKVFPDTTQQDYPDDPAASLAMAKREWEGFQIGIVPASGRRLDNVRVVVGDLTSGQNTIPAANIDWKLVGLINNGGRWTPEMLLPATDFDMAEDDTHSVVVTVKTDAGTAAGDYAGTVTIKTDSGLDTVVDVTVHVYDFTLPAGAGNFKTAFALQIARKSWETGEYREFGDFMLTYRLNPDDIYRNSVPSISDLDHFYENGMNSFCIIRGDSNAVSTTTTFLTSLASAEHAQALRDMAYLYGYDEKGPDWWETMKSKWADYESACSDIERLTTAHVYAQEPWYDPAGDMAYYNIDRMCAETYDYSFEDGEIVRNAGGEYWSYHARFNMGTKELVYPRSTFWTAYRQKSDGFLYYCVNNWTGQGGPSDVEPVDPHDGPYVDYTISGSGCPAELLFVGTTGPIAGLRLYNLRDSIEDWEYLNALCNRIEDIEVARELSEKVCWGMQDCSTTPQDYLDEKEEVADWTTRQYLAKDPTPDHRSSGSNASTDLSWEADSGDVDSFHVYFGESYEDVLNADTNSDEYKGNQVGTSYDPGTLEVSNGTYYWRIDEVVDGEVYPGYVWKFKTGFGMCGHWKFDETSGSTAADSSGRGNDGTLSGSYSHVTGILSNAVEFVGNGDVSIPAAALAPLDRQVTVSFWQYGAPGQPQSQRFFEATSASTVVIRAHTATNGTVYFDAGGSSYDRVTTVADVHLLRNRWNFWAFTKNADTGYMRIYVNGEMLAEAGSKTQALGTAIAFRIAASSSGSYDYEGMIDDFRVYDVAMSGTEVADLMAATYQTGGKGLVGWWRFNELTGSTAKDSSDYLNHGTITGASRVDGVVGKGLEFGSSRYVSVPVDGLTFDKEISVSFWAYGDSEAQPTDSRAIEAYISGAGVVRAIVPQADGKVYWDCGNSWGYDRLIKTASPSEYAGQWNHWVFTKNGNLTSNTMKVYLNGSLWHSGGGVQPIGTLSTFKIGSKADGSGSFYRGDLDEVRLYNYELSASEVSALYSADQSDFAGLVGHWKFDENSGSTAGDDSGFDNDGTITGAAWVTGHSGSALDFEGSDYVSIPSAALSKLDKEVTVCFWQYGDTALQPQTSYLMDSAGDDVMIRLGVPFSDEKIYADMGGSNSSYDRTTNATTSSSQYEGQWNHWAFTKNTWSGEVKIYLNGEYWHGDTLKWRPFGGATTFKIGSNVNGTSNYDGVIDDVRIYNVELNETDIDAIYSE